MAARACGMLAVAFGAILVAGVWGHLLRLRWSRPRPLVLLAVLAAFLVLQVVPLLAANRRRRRCESSDDEADSI